LGLAWGAVGRAVGVGAGAGVLEALLELVGGWLGGMGSVRMLLALLVLLVVVLLLLLDGAELEGSFGEGGGGVGVRGRRDVVLELARRRGPGGVGLVDGGARRTRGLFGVLSEVLLVPLHHLPNLPTLLRAFLVLAPPHAP